MFDRPRDTAPTTPDEPVVFRHEDTTPGTGDDSRQPAEAVTVREEWLVTGEPALSDNAHGVQYPPYHFVFGDPNEAVSREGTPEERARGFLASVRAHDPSGWGGTLKLQSRVITESAWKDEQL